MESQRVMALVAGGGSYHLAGDLHRAAGGNKVQNRVSGKGAGSAGDLTAYSVSGIFIIVLREDGRESIGKCSLVNLIFPEVLREKKCAIFSI